MAEPAVPFATVRYLDSDEAVAEYLTQVLADGDTDELLEVIGYIARARGMDEVAEEAVLKRESFDAVLRVTQGLGLQLRAQPAAPSRIVTPGKPRASARDFAGAVLRWLY